MDLPQSVRIVNVSHRLNTRPINILLRLPILNELKIGQLQLEKQDRELATKHPESEELLELIALKHQYLADLDDLDFQQKSAQKEWSDACTALSSLETSLDAAKKEQASSNLKMETALKIEKEEAGSRMQKLEEVANEWEQAFNDGNAGFLIKSRIGLAIRRFFRERCESLQEMIEFSDPDMLANRCNIIGQIIANTLASLNMHDAWSNAANIQETVSNAGYRLGTALRLNGIGELTGEKIKALKEDTAELRSSMETASIGLISLGSIKPLEIRKRGTGKARGILKAMRKTRSIAIGKEHLAWEQKRVADLNNAIKNSTEFLRFTISAIMANNRLLIRAYDDYIIGATESLQAKEKISKLESGIPQATQAKSLKKTTLKELEAQRRMLKERLEKIIDAYDAKIRALEYDERKANESSVAPIDAASGRQGNEPVGQCIAEFVSKMTEIYPDMAIKHSSNLPQFKKTLERLAMLYVENNGVLSVGSIELAFTKRAHREDIDGHNKDYKIVRLGLESTNFFRLLLDCTDPQKPLVIFFGTKEESDRFLGQDSFVYASARASRNGSGKLFGILAPAVELAQKGAQEAA